MIVRLCTYLLIACTFFITNLYGMNKSLTEKETFFINQFSQFKKKDTNNFEKIKPTFSDVFFKAAEINGSTRLSPFMFPKTYNNGVIKKNIITEYFKDNELLQNALESVYVEFDIPSKEPEITIDIRTLEAFIIKNANSIEELQKQNIEKNNQLLSDLEEKIEKKQEIFKNLEKIDTPASETKSSSNDTIPSLEQVIRDEIESETPFYKKHSWIPFILGISACLFVQQTKTYIYNLKATKEEE